MGRHCDCCGSVVVSPTIENCPICQYPIDVFKEKRFLETSISDLRRVADHGGANIKVVDLIYHYQIRLNYLHQSSMRTASGPPVILTPSVVVPTPPVQAPVAEKAMLPLPQMQRPLPPQPSVPSPASSSIRKGAEVSVVQPKPATPGWTFSFKSFFADQAINILASLGAFLILAGALSFIATTPNLLQSFLIVFFVHALFGITGLATSRFPNFRVVATIYTIIFALLVPLVGFSAYRLVADNFLTLSIPVLIAIATTYAAVVYLVLALFQRFTPFAYLGMVAFLVADLAVARAFGFGYWWWPDMAMILAFVALIFVRRLAVSPQLSTGFWAILLQPARLLMYSILVLTAFCALLLLLLSFSGLDVPLRELRFSIFGASLLIMFWCGLFLWLARQRTGSRELAYLFLLSILALCYSLDFQVYGYAFALTGVALLYHLLNRFVKSVRTPLLGLSPDLEGFALVLVLLVPFLCSPLLPIQLFTRVYGTLPFVGSLPSFLSNGQVILELIALCIGFGLTISITLGRTGLRRVPTNADWCWLLLLSGFLLNWGFSLIVLALPGTPIWSFLGLTLALIALTAFIRQRIAASWAYPLDFLALSEAIFTLCLGFNQPHEIISALLLFFAVLIYAVLLFQRRQYWLFLPLFFALLAQPLLLDRSFILFCLNLLLLAASVTIRRLSIHHLNASAINVYWEWPLLTASLIGGMIFAFHEGFASKSALEDWLQITFPAGLELALISLAWYTSAALTRMKWWLVPTVGFALGALLLSANAFWLLADLTFVLAILGAGISRFAGRDWALPLNLVTLCSALMTGYSGLSLYHLNAVAWIFLGFAVLVYILGMVERMTFALWLAPCFATASMLVSAILLGDLYRPPVVVLICAILGVSLRFFPRLPGAFLNLKHRSIGALNAPSHLYYALPFYITAFAAAFLTGVYGTLSSVNNPFYSAIPDILLVYALIAFGIALWERRPQWLWLVAGFTVWSIVLAIQLNAYYIVGVGLALGVSGALIGRILPASSDGPALPKRWIKSSWNWPWYTGALLAASIIAIWPFLPVAQPGIEFITYSLLGFAILAYGIALVEDVPSLLWIGPTFAACSLLYAENNVYYLVLMAMVCCIAGMIVRWFSRFSSASSQLNRDGGRRSLWYALPFYTTALVAGLMTGVHGTFSNVNDPFYGAIPGILLVYALIAFAVLCWERQSRLLWLVACFAVWTILLSIELTAFYTTALGMATGIIGLAAGRLMPSLSLAGSKPSYRQMLLGLTWNWPWYLATLLAASVVAFGAAAPAPLPMTGFVGYSLLAFAGLTFLMMISERMPELLVFPASLAARAIWLWQPSLPLASMMAGYSVLCILIFATQFVWRIVPPSTSWVSETFLPIMLGPGGQSLVVLAIILQGGLSVDSGSLVLVGVGALLILALLVFASGFLHLSNVVRLSGLESDEVRREALVQRARMVQQWCNYGSGLLCSLVISWMLSALRLTRLDLITLAPASYILVVTPFINHNAAFARYRWLGQALAVVGSVLLLLPTLWLSFSDTNLLPTMILLGEALALLLLGITTRLRIFVLSSTSLIIVGGLHTLFLPTLGIPPSLALTLLGMLLLAIATSFALARRRLQSAWTSWS